MRFTAKTIDAAVRAAAVSPARSDPDMGIRLSFV